MKIFLKWFLITIAVVVSCFFIILFIGIVGMLLDKSNTTLQDTNIITQKQYGENYPYVIDKLKLNCSNNAVWLEDDLGNIYALNGIANNKFLNDPKFKGYTTKISKNKPYVDDALILNKGLSLCK